MFVDTTESEKNASSAPKISKLISTGLSQKRNEILQIEEVAEVRDSSPKPKRLNVEVKDGSWSLDLNIEPYKRTLVTGQQVFDISGYARGYQISPLVTKEFILDVFSLDLNNFNIHRYIETRKTNLSDGITYSRTFEALVHPHPKYNKSEEEDSLTVPYEGDKIKLSVYNGKEYQIKNIDTVLFRSDDNGMLIKTYGVMENGEFWGVESKDEFTKDIPESDFETDKAPPETYYRDIPVTGDEYKKIMKLIEKGRLAVGPRDRGMDDLISLPVK